MIAGAGFEIEEIDVRAAGPRLDGHDVLFFFRAGFEDLAAGVGLIVATR
jgi:hypothetical protein